MPRPTDDVQPTALEAADDASARLGGLPPVELHWRRGTDTTPYAEVGVDATTGEVEAIAKLDEVSKRQEFIGDAGRAAVRPVTAVESGSWAASV